MQRSCRYSCGWKCFISIVIPLRSPEFSSRYFAKMDHITVFPRPAAPELPPHRLRSCQDCGSFLKANGGSPSVVFSSVHSAMTGSIIGKCLSARDPLHTGSVRKMNGFLHIYLSLCFLKTTTASCDPGTEILFAADALFSTVTLTKPVVTHPSRTIRAITFGRSALLHRAITFFCQPRCRSQNDKPAVPLSGEIEAFFPGVGSVFCIHSSSCPFFR